MAIDQQDIETLKLYFVTKETCDTKTDEIKDKLANDNARFAVIEQQLKIISWVDKTILGLVLTGIIGALLSVILK